MAATQVDGLKQKFDVKDSALLPPLQDLPGVDRVDQPVEQRMESEDFDTENLRLSSAQVTLRRRIGGDDSGWHLKLPSSTEGQTDFHEPLGETSEGIPEHVLRLVRVHARDGALSPVFRLETRRIVHRLLDEDGTILANVCDDQVRTQALTSKPTVRDWRTWEIELVNGSRDLLEAGRDRLAAAAVRPSSDRSGRVGGLEGEQEVIGETGLRPKPKSDAAVVILAYLTEQVRELKTWDPFVRLDVPDAIHRMRVATRRIRSVLATYRRLLDDSRRVKSLRNDLKWLAGILGEARDVEVMHARLRNMLAREPGELVMGPVSRRIDVELSTAYASARGKVLEALDGLRYFRLLDALEALLAAPPLSPLASKPACKVIPKLVKRDVKRLRTLVRDIEKQPTGIGDNPALHQARKESKRLRYGAEAAAPINSKGAARLEAAAQRIQKVLADHQDSVVTRDLLRRLGGEAFLQGENGFTYGRLHALEQTAAVTAEARFYRRWKKFPSAPL